MAESALLPKLAIVAIVMLLAFPIVSRLIQGEPEPAEITWLAEIPVETERSTLIYFTADWCPPCQAMKRETWPDDGVEGAIGEWNAVKIDVDENPDLARQFAAESIPTMVVLNTDGEEVRRHVGFLSASDLLAFLRG